MDPLLNVLGQLGLGIATNAVYDLLKRLTGMNASTQQVAQEIQNQINMNGVSMHAETVINALVKGGFLVMQQSHLNANQGLVFVSVDGRAIVGSNSTLTTKNTAITAGLGSFMETNGNAQVRQNPDGRISFHVGEGGNIDFKVSKLTG